MTSFAPETLLGQFGRYDCLLRHRTELVTTPTLEETLVAIVGSIKIAGVLVAVHCAVAVAG